jgi:hypothetical protein
MADAKDLKSFGYNDRVGSSPTRAIYTKQQTILFMKKKIETEQQLFVRFSEEESNELNITPGDKFSVKVVDDGILLQKYGSIEIDLSEMSNEVLQFLIMESCDRDISVNEVFEDIIKRGVDKDE